MTPADYPKRERFFALRFARLMARTCLGATIGPDACWLLTVIASTEDSKRYSGPVTFFNPNLADQLGMSISSLDRARVKAIEAGWLHYEPGVRSKAGVYWVVIPAEESGKPDGPSCEEEGEFLRQIPTQVDDESGRKQTKQPEGNRRSNRKASDDPSYPMSFPTPSPAKPGGEVGNFVAPQDSYDDNEVAPANLASQSFPEFWDLFPRKEHEKTCRTLWRSLIGNNPKPLTLVAEIVAAVKAWLPIWAGRMPDKIPTPAKWLEGERWKDKLPTTEATKPKFKTAEQAGKETNEF